MMYNSAAEYWFYTCLELGPSFGDKQSLRRFNTPAFSECYIMYEWAALFYLENLKYPKVQDEPADKNNIRGNDENIKGIRSSSKFENDCEKQTYH